METHCIEALVNAPAPDPLLRLFERGETVYRSGDAVRGVYSIASGCVAVFAETEGGRQRMLYFAEPGDLLGVPEILGGDRFNCTAISVEPTTAHFIAKRAFDELVRSEPELSTVIARQLCRRALPTRRSDESERRSPSSR
jgi:CRP-like cAMP-binding protein